MGKIKKQLLLGLCVTLLGMTGCQSSPPKSPNPITKPSVITPVKVDSVYSSESTITNYYQAAITKAQAAKVISDSAVSVEDWILAVNHWQDSVKLLKAIPNSHPDYKLVNKVLPQYEKYLETAKYQIGNFQARKKLTSSPKIPTISSSIVEKDDHHKFSIPIQRKLGGIPVIEVIFNDRYKVLMLLDTGASRTLITEDMAKKMQVPITGMSVAKTANGLGTFETTTINKVKFGNGIVNNLEIAIGKNDLTYGLLGHDVYSNYDITLKEQTIEFKKR